MFSPIIQKALNYLKIKSSERFFYDEYGKYLRSEQSWEEFEGKINSFVENNG